MQLKEELYNKCLKVVNEKIIFLQTTLRDLTSSAANETKSTAGDKHETALAMLQIEQENTGRQLKEALVQKHLLLAIDIKIKAQHVVNGSLVKTDKGYFFISIALGRLTIGQNIFIALSPQSPLGSKFLKLKIHNNAEMNGMTYVVEEIL